VSYETDEDDANAYEDSKLKKPDTMMIERMAASIVE
jgi:hypothetical protein